MHQLAIALKRKGYQITGSDDEIFEPAKSNLAKEGILPEEIGWQPNKITKDLDAVILGMHAKADNPELLKRSPSEQTILFNFTADTGATINGNFSTVTVDRSSPKPFSSDKLISFNQK